MRGKQHDAHVRARKALARKVINRRLAWGHPMRFRQTHAKLFKARDWAAIEAILLAEALDAIASHRWLDGWGNKYGAYSPFDGQALLGQHKDVPAGTIHHIMCRMGES